MKTKRILAVLLAAVMVIGMIPMAVSADEYVAKIGDTGYVTLAAAVNAAKAGEVVTILKAGKDSGYNGYRIKEISENITIKAADGVKDIVLDFTGTGSVCSIPNGATFEGLKLLFGSGSPYHGFYSSPKLTFNKCSFVGEFWTYATTVNCTDCDFTVTSHYAFYVYGTKLVNLNNCRFHGGTIGKAVKVAKDGDPTPVTIIANKCEFESDKANKNAFMLDTRYSPITTIVNDCTFDDAFTSTSVESNKYGYGTLVCWDEYAGSHDGGTGGSKNPGYIAVGSGLKLDADNKVIAGTLTEYVDSNEKSALLADGSSAIKNENGTWTVKSATELTPALDGGNITLGFTTTAAAYLEAEALEYDDGNTLNFVICDENDEVIGKSEVEKLDEKTQVRFPVNPAEISKGFTAKLVNTSKEKEKEIGTVSMADYCHTMIEDSSDEQLVTLCESILDYGCAAQDLFLGGHSEADEANLEQLPTTDENIENIPIKAVLTTANFPKIKADMSFFVLENATVRIYFDTNYDGNYFDITTLNGTLNGCAIKHDQVETNETEIDGKMYDYVEITGIKPSDLGTKFLVSMSNVNGGEAFEYSALQCVYDLMIACQGQSFNAAEAIYPSLVNYYLAASAYFGN